LKTSRVRVIVGILGFRSRVAAGCICVRRIGVAPEIRCLAHESCLSPARRHLLFVHPPMTPFVPAVCPPLSRRCAIAGLSEASPAVTPPCWRPALSVITEYFWAQLPRRRTAFHSFSPGYKNPAVKTVTTFAQGVRKRLMNIRISRRRPMAQVYRHLLRLP